MEISGQDSFSGWDMRSTALRAAGDSVEKINKAAGRISEGDIRVENFVALKEEFLLYSINLKLIKIADEMIGQTLDILV
jgi:hypothetical protein